MLDVKNVHKRFGGLVALEDVSLSVHEGSIFGLIGPNGSGKTTLVNIISGFLRPTQGHIVFDGRDIQHRSPVQIARAGLCRTFQITLNPQTMTVMENMLLGAPEQRGERIIAAALHPARVREQEAQNLERAWELLAMVHLQGHADELAGSLSGGQKKLLSLVQILMAKPRLILLDEPVAGVNPRLIEDIVDVIVKLRERGHTFLLIEHNMQVVRRMCDQICVLDMGHVLAQGEPEEVLSREEVLRAYISAGGDVASAGGTAGEAEATT